MTSPKDPKGARARAWKTRRKKYGAKGHSGVYRSAPGGASDAKYRTCVDFLCRLMNEGTLSEGQVARVTGMHRVDLRKIADEQNQIGGAA